tara:strand:+ start:4600 stop:5589 length:990 start_codon:yes stop_codon:yes gene_type:complete
MNYYYTISKKFLRNFHSNLNQEQAYEVFSFFKDNFFSNDNFSLKMERKLLTHKFGESKVAHTFKDFKKKIALNIKDFYKNKNVPIDFCFIGDSEKEKKYGGGTNYITCQKILTKLGPLEKQIKNNYKRFWIGSNDVKSKNNLINVLNRIFKSCDKIWIIDRYVPTIALKSEEFQVNGYKNTFDCYGSLIKKSSIDHLHISNLSAKQLESMQEITKEKFEGKFLDICKAILAEEEKILIKKKCHEALHNRYLITIIKVPDESGKTNDEMLNIYHLNQGDLMRDKYSTQNRDLTREEPFKAEELWEMLSKTVQNPNNYAFISKSGFNYKNN